MPLTSFLVTVFNCERYVREAVTSALRQDGDEPTEVVVVNDGSDDGTSASLRSISDPRLTVIDSARVGRSRALNLGIANARGRYVAILDADDLALPNRISVQTRYMRANPDVALVGSRYRTCIDAQGRRVREDVEPLGCREILEKLRSSNNALFHSSVMFEKAEIEAIGGYDADLPCFVDMDLYVRLAKTRPLCNIDERFALKRVHEKQFFAGRDGVHFSAEARTASKVISERVRELPADVI